MSSILTFYEKPDYFATMQNEVCSLEPQSPMYKYNPDSVDNAIIKIAKSILFSVYNFFQYLIGKIAVPATSKSVDDIGFSPRCWSLICEKDSQWKAKRVSIEVNGKIVDALMMGREETLKNGRWVLYGVGNGHTYEEAMNSYLEDLTGEIDANIIFFNYPGVGASEGHATKKSMADANRGVLKFLEDEVKAKEIILYGFSIGGGVQAEALDGYDFREDVKYVSVKEKTFESLSSVVTAILPTLGRFVAKPLLKLFDWDFQTAKGSRALPIPEVVIQSATEIDMSKNPDAIFDDGVIKKSASLAKRLIDDGVTSNKHFIGVSSNHFYSIYDETSQIASTINDLFQDTSKQLTA
jgi:hypothetical protein